MLMVSLYYKCKFFVFSYYYVVQGFVEICLFFGFGGFGGYNGDMVFGVMDIFDIFVVYILGYCKFFFE